MPRRLIGLPENRCPSRIRRWRRAWIATMSASGLVLASMVAVVGPQSASADTLGAGSYTTTLPAGQKLPTGCGDISTNPREWVTANAPTGAIPTNDWWSSILYKRTDCSFGEPMFAHPAAYDSYPGGLGISYATTPVITGSSDRGRRVQVPLHPRRPGRGRRAQRAAASRSTAGRTGPSPRSGPTAPGPCAPPSATACRCRTTQVSGGDAQLSTDGTPDVWLQQRRTRSASASVTTTTSRTRRPVRAGRSRAL